jgi:hypothetical protein
VFINKKEKEIGKKKKRIIKTKEQKRKKNTPNPSRGPPRAPTPRSHHTFNDRAWIQNIRIV